MADPTEPYPIEIKKSRPNSTQPNGTMEQCCSQGQNPKAKDEAKARTLKGEAKAWTLETKTKARTLESDTGRYIFNIFFGGSRQWWMQLLD